MYDLIFYLPQPFSWIPSAKGWHNGWWWNNLFCSIRIYPMSAWQRFDHLMLFIDFSVYVVCGNDVVFCCIISLMCVPPLLGCMWSHFYYDGCWGMWFDKLPTMKYPLGHGCWGLKCPLKHMQSVNQTWMRSGLNTCSMLSFLWSWSWWRYGPDSRI